MHNSANDSFNSTFQKMIYLSLHHQNTNLSFNFNIIHKHVGQLSLCWPFLLVKNIFSSPGNCPGWTVIDNSVCVFVSIFTPVAQLTDKMDPCIVHQNDCPESHNDAHKKIQKNEENLPSNYEGKSYLISSGPATGQAWTVIGNQLKFCCARLRLLLAFRSLSFLLFKLPTL